MPRRTDQGGARPRGRLLGIDFALGDGAGIADPSVAHAFEFGIGELLIGLRLVQKRRHSLKPRGRGLHIGLSLEDRTGVEQVGIAWFDGRQQCFAG